MDETTETTGIDEDELEEWQEAINAVVLKRCETPWALMQAMQEAGFETNVQDGAVVYFPWALTDSGAEPQVIYYLANPDASLEDWVDMFTHELSHAVLEGFLWSHNDIPDDDGEMLAEVVGAMGRRACLLALEEMKR